jgi:hypothetical protein
VGGAGGDGLTLVLVFEAGEGLVVDFRHASEGADVPGVLLGGGAFSLTI